MEMSSEINELAAALAKAQGEMKAAEMTATNPFLKNKYADLGENIKVAKEPLAKNGLAVAQPVSGNGDQITVTTILMHSSGQWMRETVMLPLGDEKGKSTAQVAGSVITYLRRYSLAAMIGLYADEDTDGNDNRQPNKPPPPPAEQPAEETPETETAQVNGENPDPLTYTAPLAKIGKHQYPQQWGRVCAAYTRANQYEVDGILQKLRLPQGTRPEAVIDAINKHLDTKAQ